jgi:hypothetical protein
MAPIVTMPRAAQDLYSCPQESRIAKLEAYHEAQKDELGRLRQDVSNQGKKLDRILLGVLACFLTAGLNIVFSLLIKR